MRKRLTDKVAAEIMNDPYQVNNPDHEKNDPNVDAYAKGSPEDWAEGVNKDDLWKKDKRTETNHPEITAKMAAEAVQSARKLEERAVKCIVASQRILPGAEESMIECQAADLMHLPDNMVDALLGRQEELANSISKSASDASEEAEDEDGDEEDGKEKEAASKAQEKSHEKFKKMIEKKKREAAREAAEIAKLEKALEAGEMFSEDEKDEKDKEGEKSASKKENPEDTGEQGAVEDEPHNGHPASRAAGNEDAEEEKEDAEEDKEDEDAEEKTAGDNLLDDIFSSVTASEKKQGAKTLSGMVKKEASSGSDNDLSSVWSAPPDVSKHFR